MPNKRRAKNPRKAFVDLFWITWKAWITLKRRIALKARGFQPRRPVRNFRGGFSRRATRPAGGKLTLLPHLRLRHAALNPKRNHGRQYPHKKHGPPSEIVRHRTSHQRSRRKSQRPGTLHHRNCFCTKFRRPAFGHHRAARVPFASHPPPHHHPHPTHHPHTLPHPPP